MSAYPPPWRLRGWAVQTLHAVPTAVARRYVPVQVPILPIWPSYTLATILFASYESGTLAYHELLLGIGLVRLHGPRLCIPHLWVDSEASVAGGREIWKLPKHLASFNIERSEDAIAIETPGICRIEARTNRYSVPLWLPVLAFGNAPGTLFPFNASMRARASLARIHVTPFSGEFASMQLSRPLLGVRYEALDVVVHGPRFAFDGLRGGSRNV